MVFQNTYHLEAMDVIKQMKSRKSSGCDGTNSEILKCCSPVVENATTNAFHRCIEEITFLRFSNIVKVAPIFKEGDGKKQKIIGQLAYSGL